MPMSFIFGEGTNTPDAASLRRKREMADMLIQSSLSRAPQTFGEGLTAIGQALAGRMQDKRISEQEAAERERVGSQFSSITGQLMGGNQSSGSASPSYSPQGSSPQSSPAAIDRNNPQVIANEAMRAVGRSPEYVRYANSDAVRSQPLDPSMYDALSFLPELGVEMEVFSGGQPARGTSDRRVGSTRHDDGRAADVFFYKDGRKLDWANPDDVPLFQEIVRRGRAAGLTGFGAGEGYMQPGSMHIGFGNEAVWGAGGRGANAPQWLRDAYSGAQPSQGQPQQQGARPQGGGISPSVMQLAELAANPYLPEGQRIVAQQLIQQQMQSMDPMRQMQMEKAQLELEAMRNPQAGYRQVFGRDLGLEGDAANTMFNIGPDGKISQIGGAGVTVNNNMGDNAPRLGTLSQDYGYVLDPETGQPVIDPETGLPQSAPIPGSPSWQEQRDQEEASIASDRSASDYARTVTQDIGIAQSYLDILGPMSGQDGIIGANLRKRRAEIAGTPEYNMKGFVDSALSNLTLDTMNRMRETSAAGATGMGNMSNQQLKVIQGVLGNWEPGLPVEEQRFILGRLGNFYLDVQVGTRREREEAVRDGRLSPKENAEIEAMYWPETRDQVGRRIDQGQQGDPAELNELLMQDTSEFTLEELREYNRRLEELLQ